MSISRTPSPPNSRSVLRELVFGDEEHKLAALKPDISKALNGFEAIPCSLWFREVSLCLLTPQSSPFRAEACITNLEKVGLFEGKLTATKVAKVLRDPKQYIRFHNQKAKRLIKFVESKNLIEEVLNSNLSSFEERERLIKLVDGFSYKEASHALRNIGRTGLAILDRHILRRLVEFKIIDSLPKTLTPKRYIETEARFKVFAESLGESIDVLDLFFWGSATGKIFK